MLKVAVIDGQGGGIGKAIITEIKRTTLPLYVIAVGTNALATSAMIKAGADVGATGENAIIYNAGTVDIIIGPIGLLIANSMYGEMTPKMTLAVSESKAKKIIVPVSKCDIYMAGMVEKPMSQYIEDVIAYLDEIAYVK